jgi:SOS-response transcriptional repressor LexA
MTAPLDRRLKAVKWGGFKLGDLFDHIAQGRRLKKNDQLPGDIPFVMAGVGNTGVVNYVSNPVARFPANSITVDIFGNAFYRNYAFGAGDDTGVYWNATASYAKEHLLFMAIAINRAFRGKFSFGNKLRSSKSLNLAISLPVTTSGSIDFSFMENIIHEVEKRRILELEEERRRELVAYLAVAESKTCELTGSERSVLAEFGKLKWREYNVKKLFGLATRGKRLKGDDRIPGSLPFVTAGEAETGVSAFIGNTVQVFGKNTTTIDMFGSAKYRNYEYGADDHVAVVHTEKLPKHAAIFVTAACHKAAHTGAFDYGHNFYAKDADALTIMLPALPDGSPDYATMGVVMRAVQKLVVRDVVAWKDREIAAARKVVAVEGGRSRPQQPSETHILPEVAAKLRFHEYLPLYSLKAACGKFGDGEAVEPQGWVEADIGRKLDGKMFVVRASGRSMEPKIRDGDLCVMRVLGPDSGGTRNGKIVLAQHRDTSDPETGGAYSIKRYSSEKAPDGNSWRHERITLSPLNPDFSPLSFGPDTPEEALKIVAEFIAVLPDS